MLAETGSGPPDDYVILCPNGLSSDQLRQVPPGSQYWFLDMRTGEVFSYPPRRRAAVGKWLEAVWQGQDVSFPTDYRSYLVLRGRPWITWSLLAANTLIFLLMNLAGGSNNSEVLILFGAKVNELIRAGEVWRLVTANFLHIGMMHAVFNLYSLYVLGPVAELRFGRANFLVLYLVSGVGATTASYFFSAAVSAGASGAIFGLLAAVLADAWRRPRLWRAGLIPNLVAVIGVNLAFGFIQPGIRQLRSSWGLGYGFSSGGRFGRRQTVSD